MPGVDLSRNNQDEYLNLFMFYGKPHLENNITKALINTFDSLNEQSKLDFLRDICKVIPTFKPSFRLFLQTKPGESDILAVPEDNRILMAISPSGKSWGYDGIDTNDENCMKKSITKAIKEAHPDWDDDEIAKSVDDEYRVTQEIIHGRGESIPDAWILVYDMGKPQYCIAWENKLMDLNPFQLNNHCQKSLFLHENKIIHYSKYANLCDFFNVHKTYIAEEFVRYLFILNYYKISRLSQLDGVKTELATTYAQQYSKTVLDTIGSYYGERVSYHRGWGSFIRSRNPYNKEIGLFFEDGKYIAKLYFCPTQRSGRDYFASRTDNYMLSLPDSCRFIKSFHLQHVGIGKNVRGSYYVWDSGCSADNYLKFWRDNYQLLKQSDIPTLTKLMKEMVTAGLIAPKELEAFHSSFGNSQKKMNVCAEFGVWIEWSFNQAKKLDNEGSFVTDVMNRIKDVYTAVGVQDSFFNP